MDGLARWEAERITHARTHAEIRQQRVVVREGPLHPAEKDATPTNRHE